MSVYIVGDTHGRFDLDKLFAMNFDARGLTKNDYVIVCGDFGLVWDAPGSSYHYDNNEATLDWLGNKPWTTLFIDGNHENHDQLASYPVSTWHGGQVHFIRESVIHLMRGEMFDIDGSLFFAMGGARSIDSDMRVEGESWWAYEVPDDYEKEHAIATLDKYDWTCDYVLTHDCPANVKFDLGCRTGKVYEMDAWEQWLQYVSENLTFSHWFFGHYHEDYKNIGLGGKFTVLYNYVYDLTAQDWSDRMRVPRVNSYDQLPEPANQHGYTIAEIADIVGLEEEDIVPIVDAKMKGSTVAVNEDGEVLIYRSDLFKILDWI